MFEDDNLALAVLEALLDLALVPRSAVEQVVAANPYDRTLYWNEIMGDVDEAELGIASDADREAYFQDACGYRRLNWDVCAALVRLVEKSSAHVPAVRDLMWVVPASVMYACWRFFDGESDEFDITSLAGIERCSGLESIHIEHLAGAVDLTPLTRLPALARLVIRGRVAADQDWRPLLAIPSLRSVTAGVDDAVAAALAARGVTVKGRS